MTARGLKKLFDQTWEMAQKTDKENFNFEQSFKDLFGK